MPHEKINHGRTDKVPQELVVGWDRLGWVQVSIYPEGWSTTGDASIVDVTPRELDLLIKTLKRARRQAYGGGQTWHGFSDSTPTPTE